jgi:uncharacterized protein YjdB
MVFKILAALLFLLFSGCSEFFRGSNDLIAISVGPSNSTIQPGGTQQYTATGTFGPTGATTEDVTQQVTWSSSNPAIATINSAGLATGIADGTVTISASSQNLTASTSLSVGNQTATLTSIAVTPANTTLAAGATQQFTATATFSNGTTSDITSSATWASSSTTVATISTTGLATALAAGRATITATSGTISGNTTLTVQ